MSKVERVERWLERGQTLAEACRMVGITPNGFRKARRKLRVSLDGETASEQREVRVDEDQLQNSR